jgi:hypothetical protein
MGAMDVPVPFSPVLEDQTVPTAGVGGGDGENTLREMIDKSF